MMRDLNKTIINALESVKGFDIITLDVSGLTDVMDAIVVVSGNTNRQVKALASVVVEDCKKAGFTPLGVEGAEVGEWVLVDLGDIVVHVMLPETRVFYDLEKLWSMGPKDVAAHEAGTGANLDLAGE